VNYRERYENVQGAFDVTFRTTSDPSILVPERAWEWSRSEDPDGSDRPCFVEGQAEYSNVRRFTVRTEEQLK
jgi:hypothetical protein